MRTTLFRHVFLIDALGALTSALCLMFLYHIQSGLPAHLMAGLIITAMVFFVYSFVCHRTKPKGWPQLLRGIAIANVVYAMVTASLCFGFFDQLMLLARGYFIAECCVLVLLAGIELRVAHSARPAA